MISFNDGPAKGHLLQLARAPIFLRVVRDPAGNIDALDQVDDEPIKTEEIFVYFRMMYRGQVHIHSSIKGRRHGGWYAMASYRQMKEAIIDEPMLRDTAKWQAWCLEAAAGLKGKVSE